MRRLSCLLYCEHLGGETARTGGSRVSPGFSTLESVENRVQSVGDGWLRRDATQLLTVGDAVSPRTPAGSDTNVCDECAYVCLFFLFFYSLVKDYFVPNVISAPMSSYLYS